jgi:hypothetical protein
MRNGGKGVTGLSGSSPETVQTPNELDSDKFLWL